MIINGNIKGERVSSRKLEEEIQHAIKKGERAFTVHANGQHGIGGRIWPQDRKVRLTVDGPVGQRLGSMGMMGTEITVKGSCSDDAGWINCGARITVLGDVTNGAHNAGAQGVLYVQGGGGARCDTMTKFNPRFEPLQSWYFRDVGDSFAEFKAGGIAVVCGVEPRNPDNILGYRPCVGMVGGTIYFRGPIQGFSENDVKQVELSDADWEWLTKNIKPYLKAVDRTKHLKELTRDRADWQKLIAYTPAEKAARKGARISTTEFRQTVWEPGVGKGGIFGEYLDHPQTILPYVTEGEDRRFKPMWYNEKYLPPCAYACPSRIPSHKRASLIRQGRLEEALALVLEYSPFPASVCGQVCPNLCMDACSRGLFVDKPHNIKQMGSLSLEVPTPKKARSTGKTVAVIGGGPGGLSAAWQLALRGHNVDLYEAGGKLGGKMEMAIPRERLSKEVLTRELSRFEEIGVDVHFNTKVNRKLFGQIYKDHEVVIVASGAHEARMIKFPGWEDVIPGIEFLKAINFGEPEIDMQGKRVIVIGAGNVGMDIACQAYNVGAQSVVAVDIQPPASFGIERETAEARGAKIVWPRITERYDAKKKKIFFTDGSSMDADAVIISIGESPVLDFLPAGFDIERGYLIVDENGRTSDAKVFAIGDATRPGLITNAIGQGRITADAVNAQMMEYDIVPELKQVIPYERIKSVYYEGDRNVILRSEATKDLQTSPAIEQEANTCMSCGLCRDCGMCEAVCYYGAITRVERDGDWEYVVDDEKCIGCGFCAGTCPSGVWEMVENV
ncbi:MAG: FAD-dependent oxidoreductase [Thermoleophilia bacterium]|jgi:NADPH-dependent glutamate synthase beta subunit-like oxidoreductase/glutamate synthase domain-containing protein 3/NAD-dependent dihydropyrimidine dehydrogenase PreA subunit